MRAGRRVRRPALSLFEQGGGETEYYPRMQASVSSRATSIGVGLLFFGALAIGVAYAAAVGAGASPAWALWFVAFGGTACAVGLFVIGAASRGPIRPLIGWLLAALFVVIFAVFGTALAMRTPDSASEPIVLGLPVRLAMVFYGVGLLPLLVLPVVFAMTIGKDQKE